MKQRFNECFDELYSIGKNQHIMEDTKIKALDVFLKHYENSILKNCSEDKK